MYQWKPTQGYFLFAWNGMWKAPSSATLYRRGNPVQVDQCPRVSGSGSEALVDIHAARRISYEPALCISKVSVQGQNKIYLASPVIVDESPELADDDHHRNESRIRESSHAWNRWNIDNGSIFPFFFSMELFATLLVLHAKHNRAVLQRERNSVSCKPSACWRLSLIHLNVQR